MFTVIIRLQLNLFLVLLSDVLLFGLIYWML